MWEQLGKPRKLHLVELGPGRGTMMHDILATSRWFQDFQISLRIHLVENSPILREAQFWSVIQNQDKSAYNSSENPISMPTTRRPLKDTKGKPFDVNRRNGQVFAETKEGIPVEWHWHIKSLPTDGRWRVMNGWSEVID